MASNAVMEDDGGGRQPDGSANGYTLNGEIHYNTTPSSLDVNTIHSLEEPRKNGVGPSMFPIGSAGGNSPNTTYLLSANRFVQEHLVDPSLTPSILPEADRVVTTVDGHHPEVQSRDSAFLPSITAPVVGPSNVMIPMEFVEKMMDWQALNLRAVRPTSTKQSTPSGGQSDTKNRLSQQLTGIPSHVLDQLMQMEVQNLEDIKLLLTNPDDLKDIPLLHRRKLEQLLKNEESDRSNGDAGKAVNGRKTKVDVSDVEKGLTRKEQATSPAPVRQPASRLQTKDETQVDAGKRRDSSADSRDSSSSEETSHAKETVEPKHSSVTKKEVGGKKAPNSPMKKPHAAPRAGKTGVQAVKKDNRETTNQQKNSKVKLTKPDKVKAAVQTARASKPADHSSQSDSEEENVELQPLPSKNGKDGAAVHFAKKIDEKGQKTTVDMPALKGEGKGKKKKKTPFWRRCFGKSKKKDVSVSDLKKEIDMDDHIILEEELFHKLEVDPNKGLTESEAASRLQRDGKNVLKPPKQKPEILKFLSELFSGFSPLLLAGAVLAFVAWGIEYAEKPDEASFDNLYLGTVLVAVVAISGGFLYLQKRKSEKIMASFKNMLPQHANVLRDGKVKKVDADDLVLGDIVMLKAGDAVPADMRVLESENLKVDNSSLTGESEPQLRNPEGSENPLESKNLCFYTSNVVEGSGRGVIILRGEQTVLGRIAQLTMSVDDSETTIAKEIRAFVKLVSIFACITGIVCCVVPLALGFHFIETAILAIGLIVANVPEGVVIAVTVMLTLTAQRMAKKNCLVKTLEAVETLGSCSIICSDKTGTLTQNKMTVAHCWIDDKLIEIDAKTHGDKLPESHTLDDLIRVATLCNHAEFVPGGRKSQQSVSKKEVVGDASETALLRFVEGATGESSAMRDDYDVVLDVPFNSTTKLQVSIHQTEAGEKQRYLMVMKGAPEQIWEKCSTILADGEEQDIDDEWKEKFKAANLQLGELGERVLGFCDLWLPEGDYPVPTEFDAENANYPLEGLRFIGLIAMIDPPRPAVGQAILRSRSAGIRILMVTGDQPVTAEAIARYVGIISEGATVDTPDDRTIGDDAGDGGEGRRAIVIHGQEQLKAMNDDDIDEILRDYHEIVFARTSPQQKLVIVDACQRTGAIVAVTGDGVNDSPALKKSNIGIAMGITGSDVSKQAADIVLLDDNFSSIITGIEEGRLIFDNLKKTICYSIMSNIPEITPVLAYIILDIPLALTVIPMLLLCLVTDMVPSISLAYEKPEGNIMAYPPRDVNDRLVNSRLIHCAYMQAGVIASAGAFFAYFVVFGECGFWPMRLFGIREQWQNQLVDNVTDSYGQEWNYSQRMKLQHTVNTAYFVAVVVFQWADLICRKVRRLSIFQQGMRNWFLNASLLLEILVAALLTYIPHLNEAFSLQPILFRWWLPVLPFALYFFIFDELRRLLIRRRPGGWVEKEFYF